MCLLLKCVTLLPSLLVRDVTPSGDRKLFKQCSDQALAIRNVWKITVEVCWGAPIWTELLIEHPAHGIQTI
jgi:hypothetical protein